MLQGGRVVTTGANAYRYLPMGPTSKQGDEFEEQNIVPALLPSPLVQGAPKITINGSGGLASGYAVTTGRLRRR